MAAPEQAAPEQAVPTAAAQQPLQADQMVYDRPPWAVDFIPQLARAPRPVRVLSPCVGVNAPERAARELEFPWQSAGDYDINPVLRPALTKLTKAPQLLFVGARQGSVVHVPLNSLDLEVDGIVSGPPCPPFSSMGKRLVEMDARSSVFVSVCLWIIHLATHGKLAWFILENVAGILKRKRGENTTFADWFMAEMARDLPTGWEVLLHQHNSKQCLLPQSRPRCFFVGTAPRMRSTPFQRRVLSAAPRSWPDVDIISFLDQVAAPDDWDELSLRQKINVEEQLEQFHIACAAPGSTCAGTVAVVDVARDPLRSIDSKFTVGGTRTLRTNCSHLWILPSPRWQSVFGQRGRRLNRAEKCRVAGIVPGSLSELAEPDLDIAVGNTIPVPLIGVVLAPVLRAWAQMERDALMGGHGNPA